LDQAETLTQGSHHMILHYDRSDCQSDVSDLRYWFCI